MSISDNNQTVFVSKITQKMLTNITRAPTFKNAGQLSLNTHNR